MRLMQILNGGAPCQQVDSEEEDEQEGDADDEVSLFFVLRSAANAWLACCVLLSVPTVTADLALLQTL